MRIPTICDGECLAFLGETPGASYYYILATGDLNGDGIDELVVREMGFEKESRRS
jgi:hypothetical protein